MSYEEQCKKVLLRLLDEFVEYVYQLNSAIIAKEDIKIPISTAVLMFIGEIIADLLPEDFEKKYLYNAHRHIGFVEYYYKEKNYEMMLQNAHDLLVNDTPPFRNQVFSLIPVSKPKEEVNLEEVMQEVIEKLRPTIHDHPETEREVQNALENLFTIKDYDFEREKVSIPYSTKSYIPDFTSDSLNTAVDVKVCKSPQDEKKIIDQLNADIPGYQSRYKNVFFVVYDLGYIRRVQTFIRGIEENHQNVFVRVIKH